MKANLPSLIVYFAACLFVIGFNFLGDQTYVNYSRSFIVPAIFVYYLITNNYKIDLIKGGIFLFSFIGDIFNILKIEESPIGALISFLISYLLLLKLIIDDFRRIRLDKNDVLSMLVITVAISIIAFSVLSLKFEDMQLDFSVYVIYGLTLSLLSLLSIMNYMKKGTYAFFNLIITITCFLISDIFFILNSFYLKLYIFSMTGLIPQVLSYFFLVNYFIENEKDKAKLNTD